MESAWRVLIADELGITRRAMATALRTDSPNHDVIECGTIDAVLAALEQEEATLLLVDLMSPGLDLVAAARERQQGLKIVVMAGYDQPFDALHALQAGADGFLVKGMHPGELMVCLRCVVETGVVVTSRVLKRALTAAPDRSGVQPCVVESGRMNLDEHVAEVLTPREREIFELMARNCSNKEIAALLHIAEQTVKVHVSRILTKLGQPNRAQAVIHGLRGTHRTDPKVVSFRGSGRN